MFPISHGPNWDRPDIAYCRYLQMAAGIDKDEIEYNGRYKHIREQRDLAIFGLCLYQLFRTTFFVQMNNLSASPDAFVMRAQPENPLTHEIAPVEITFYGRNKLNFPDESLFARLTKTNGKFRKLPPGYWLLIHIGLRYEEDLRPILNFLQNNNSLFFVFSIQEVENNSGNTVARFVSYQPRLEIVDIDIGEAADLLKHSSAHGTVIQKRGYPPAS